MNTEKKLLLHILVAYDENGEAKCEALPDEPSASDIADRAAGLLSLEGFLFTGAVKVEVWSREVVLPRTSTTPLSVSHEKTKP